MFGWLKNKNIKRVESIIIVMTLITVISGILYRTIIINELKVELINVNESLTKEIKELDRYSLEIQEYKTLDELNKETKELDAYIESMETDSVNLDEEIELLRVKVDSLKGSLRARELELSEVLIGD